MAVERVCVVCLGNICRSPLGEGVLRQAVMTRGLRIRIDSAGTGNWHVGKSPDKRSIAEARRRGVDISKQRARQWTTADFKSYDVILAMDSNNLKNLQALARSAEDADKVKLLLPDGSDVPDPYYGNAEDFAHVYDLVEQAANHWIEQWK
jgi:protein-tyrosine phosphatase